MKHSNPVRRFVLPVLMAAACAAGPALAQINIHVNMAPPAVLQEPVPVMQPGYVWAPGYWAWSGDRHIWVRGRMILHRDGYRWEPDRWEQRDATYYRTPGRWERDADYRVVKVKKEKKPKHWERDDDDRGQGDDDKGRHGKGHKQKD